MNDVFILPLINSDIPCLVDIDKREELLKYRWRYDGCNGYVSYRKRIGNNRFIHCYLHNFLMGIRRGTDHRNRCKLDNRLSNLRKSSYSQNNVNREKSETYSSKFKGVFWNKINNNWNAQITVSKGVKKHLGCFDNEIDAAKEYNRAALFVHKDFAVLNNTDVVN